MCVYATHACPCSKPPAVLSNEPTFFFLVFCAQYQDDDFGQLSGARIVRIATHPDYQGMGYGKRAIEQLKAFYDHQLIEYVHVSVHFFFVFVPLVTPHIVRCCCCSRFCFDFYVDCYSQPI